MWVYLHRVLWNWAGILLSVDATVALLERYLGSTVERWLHWKPHVPDLIKISFAVIVLLISQGLAYRDVQQELVQAGKDNYALHTAINALNADIVKQQLEIKRLANLPPKVVRPASPSRDEADKKKRETVRTHLGLLMDGARAIMGFCITPPLPLPLNFLVKIARHHGISRL